MENEIGRRTGWGRREGSKEKFGWRRRKGRRYGEKRK
jgi:hypothetical protein